MEQRTPPTMQQAIPQFTTLPVESLALLIRDLSLTMTVRDLAYCQNQYRMREHRNPTGEELRLLDSLYSHRAHRLESLAIRHLYTSDAMVAETYADMVAKSARLHRDTQPYTPAMLSECLRQILARAGRPASVPSLFAGKNAPLSLLQHGYTEGYHTSIDSTLATVGLCNASSITSADPLEYDHILLLSAPDLSTAAFAEIIRSLHVPPQAQMLPIDHRGLLEALLTWDGVYLVQNNLPGMKTAPVLSDLVTSFEGALLIRLSGDLVVPIRERAEAAGLNAAVIGKCMLGQKLTIRQEGGLPVQLETAFLRSFSPILPVDVEIPGNCLEGNICTSASLTQTVSGHCDCLLFPPALPGTPYTAQESHLVTGAISYDADNTFLSSLLTTMFAVNRAVAAGADYESLTLSNQIAAPSTAPNLAVGELMAALLGSYRVQAELAIPDVNSHMQTATNDREKAGLTVAAAAPRPKKLLSHTFTAPGNMVYLLTPLSGATSPVDFEDYRNLLRYVHHLCTQGIARAAIAVDATGVITALKTMTQQGYGFLAHEELPLVHCGFLIETDQVIQGTLVGLTTASPTICIGNRESTVTSFRQTPIEPDQIPMSCVGCAQPVICLSQVRTLGNIAPITQWVQERGAIIHAVPVTDLSSRDQLTSLAKAMMESNIAILVGTTDEINGFLTNRRVAYAEEQLLSHDGLLLCLHTDIQKGKNQPIPQKHPFFYHTPTALFDRAALHFEGERRQVVHMSASCAAIPQMLACAIAYFQ